MSLQATELIEYRVLNRLLKYSEANITTTSILNSCHSYFKKAEIDFPNNCVELINLSIQNNQKLDTSEIQIKLENLNISFEKSQYLSKWDLPFNSVLRYAINPNYEPTLGNLRGISIHKKLKESNPTIKVFLRFDDTDPLNKPSIKSAYNSYMNALDWLNLEVDSVYSLRVPLSPPVLLFTTWGFFFIYYVIYYVIHYVAPFHFIWSIICINLRGAPSLIFWGPYPKK